MTDEPNELQSDCAGCDAASPWVCDEHSEDDPVDISNFAVNDIARTYSLIDGVQMTRVDDSTVLAVGLDPDKPLGARATGAVLTDGRTRRLLHMHGRTFAVRFVRSSL